MPIDSTPLAAFSDTSGRYPIHEMRSVELEVTPRVESALSQRQGSILSEAVL